MIDVGNAVLRAQSLDKSYPAVRLPKRGYDVFHDVSISVAAGEMLAIVGASGSGKSTLLHLLALLDEPTAGEIWCNGVKVAGAGIKLTSRQQAEYRNRDIGYVWQFHYLLPEFTAQENVAMPLLARGTRQNEAMKAAAKWLERVGLGDRQNNRAGELSGGEQQRVSIARALVTGPKVLLADEPTGDLDGETAGAIFTLLQGLCREEGLAVVVVTHNMEFASRCDQVRRFKDKELLLPLARS